MQVNLQPAIKKRSLLPDEERDDTLRQWRIESDVVPMTNLAGLGAVISYAAKSYQTGLNKYHITGCNSAGGASVELRSLSLGVSPK